MLKILSDPMINQTIGSSAQTGPCHSVSGYLVFPHFAAKSIQNNQI